MICKNRENAIRKYWASNFPLLPEHYVQIKFSNSDTIQKAINLQKVDNTLQAENNTSPISKYDNDDKYDGLSF